MQNSSSDLVPSSSDLVPSSSDLVPVLSELESDSNSNISDSGSEDSLGPGDIRAEVTDHKSTQVIVFHSDFFDGICRIPHTAQEKFTCALTSENTVFAGSYDTRCELSTAVIAFVTTAAIEKKVSTNVIKRLLM